MLCYAMKYNMTQLSNTSIDKHKYTMNTQLRLVSCSVTFLDISLPLLIRQPMKWERISSGNRKIKFRLNLSKAHIILFKIIQGCRSTYLKHTRPLSDHHWDRLCTRPADIHFGWNCTHTINMVIFLNPWVPLLGLQNQYNQ